MDKRAKLSIDLADYARDTLRESLSFCTKEQQDLFLKVFPTGIKGLSEEKMRHALGLVQRTLTKNAKDKAKEETRC